MDFKKIISNIDALKGMGLLNNDLSQTFVNLHPNRPVAAIATFAAVMTIIAEYRTEQTDQANFVVFLNIPDVYGKIQVQQLFSFDFNRKLFDRVNWDNFETANLAKIAPHFKFSPWLVEHLFE